MSVGATENREMVQAATVSVYFSMVSRDRTKDSTLRSRRRARAVYRCASGGEVGGWRDTSVLSDYE